MSKIKKEDLKKEAIIKEAEKLFIKHGYKGMKIAELAKRVNLSIGSIYKFFASKELLYNIYLSNQREYYILVIQKEIPKYNTPMDKLDKLIQILLNAFIKHNNILKEHALKNPSFFMDVEAKKNNLIFQFYKVMEEEVMKPLAKTTQTKIDTLEMAFIFVGLLIGIYKYWLVTKSNELIENRDKLSKRFLFMLKEEQ